MSLRHILLGMLAKPASGYDLKMAFGSSIAYFWSAELSQIYPTLSGLEKDGLLTSRLMPSEKGPARKVYRRTREGQAVLRKWLMSGPALRQERIGFLTQVRFLDAIPAKSRMRFMQELKADFVARMKELEAAEREWRRHDPRFPDQLPDGAFYSHLTLELGKKRYAATIEWCDECLQRMRERPH